MPRLHLDHYNRDYESSDFAASRCAPWLVDPAGKSAASACHNKAMLETTEV